MFLHLQSRRLVARAVQVQEFIGQLELLGDKIGEEGRGAYSAEGEDDVADGDG